MSLTARRPVDLTADLIEGLPDRCRRCLFWELGWPRPIDGVELHDEMAADPSFQKAAWWAATELDVGPVARAVRVDGEVVGYSLVGPGHVFAARRPPIPRVSPDALLLATVWIEPAHRGTGVARTLVQAAVKEAIRSDLRAVEAYGDRRHRDGNCLIPSMWLLHEGFEIRKEHPRYPVLRLDVRSTVRWTEPLEQAVGSALARIGSRPAPEPAPGRASPA